MSDNASAKDNYYKNEWYPKNGADLNALRRHKYATDPEYKKRQKEHNAESRKRARKRKQAEKNARYQAQKISTAKLYRVVDVGFDADGQPIKETLYTIGALAKALGRSIQVVRLWEQQGIIEPPTITSDQGDRLYRVDQVAMIREQLIAQGRISETKAPASTPIEYKKQVQQKNGTIAIETLFTVGSLAKSMNRSVVAVENMERRGALPRTPLFSGSQIHRRLYTAEMIEAVCIALERRAGQVRGPEASKLFHDEIAAKWTTQGIFTWKLID